MKLVVLTSDTHDVIHGKVLNPAVYGLAYRQDPANPDNLIPATGGKYFYGAREVVAQIPLEQHIFGNSILSPVPVGSDLTAIAARRIEVEGADYLVQSGTGDVSAAVAEAKLELYQGKLRTHQGSVEIAGYIEAVLTPEDPGNTRLVVVLNR